MFRRKVLPFCMIAIIVFNRFATKIIPGGGLFEILLMLLIMKKPYSVVRGLRRFFPALLMISYALLILLLETMYFGFDGLAFRRSFLGLYAVVPVLLYAYRVEVCHFLNKYLLQLSFALFAVVLINPSGFQPTMAAQVSGCFFLACVIFKRRRMAAAIFFASFLVAASGISSGQSPYRTPILTVSLAFFSYALLVLGEKRIKRVALSNLVVLASVAFMLFSSGFMNKVVGSVLIGVGGLLDSSMLYVLGAELGGDTRSIRGDAYGTAQTRVTFWMSIFDYQFRNLKSFIFGYGLKNGFMEVTLPYLPFRDKALVEPHNSYVNIFFRFGIVGILLYVWLAAQVLRSVVDMNGWKISLPFFIIAFLFAFSEVALENPHGNLIFWFIFMMPLFFESRCYRSTDIGVK